jgi:chemotaxis protein methyltransferase WspC
MKFVGQIRERLQADTGFSPQFLQDETLRLAIQRRCELLELSDADTYWKYLQGAPVEWASLIEEVVVNETWFLRDEKPFQYLADHARKSWLGHPRKRNVLSAPCATGEEAYSIAITLVEAGLNPDQFAVDALDISERAVQAARARTYRATAFRGGKLGDSPHFEQLPGGNYTVSKRFDACVSFRTANLLDPLSFPESARFDVIFCRNLLIYLDDKARAQLLSRLEALLQDDGLLFVGHADAGAIASRRFQACGPSGAFVYHSREATAKTGTISSRAPASAVRKAKIEWVAPPICQKAEPQKSARVAVEDSGGEAALKRATELADQGKVQEASALCDAYLATRPLCPRGTHLLAVLHLAAGNREQAERLFNKVAYLDPRHLEALLHLKQLAELRGDRASAETWRRRIESNPLSTRA